MRFRRAPAGVTALLSVAVLCACSTPPEPAPDARHITAGELEGLVRADDLDLDQPLDVTFNIEPLALKAPSILSSWEASGGSPAECLTTYFASFLLVPTEAEAGPDDEFADMAGYYPDGEGGINVAARSFESEDAARDFLDTVPVGAADCNAAGGYELYSGEGMVGWGVTAVSTGVPAGFTVPDGVTALEQDETVTEDFATGYRLTLLQFDNAIVAVTAQLHTTSTFTFDQVDELSQVVAERLAQLD